MQAKMPPGPQSTVFGLDFINQFKAAPLEFASSLAREYGDIVYLKLGPIDWFLINHPDLVKEVFVTRAREFGKSGRFKQVLRSVDGNGLVVSEGDFWLKQRRTINPTFAHDKLGEYAQVMADKIDAHIAGWKDGQVLDIAQSMTDLTLKIAAKIFLGVDVEGREREFGDAVTSVSRVIAKEFTDLIPTPDWLPLPAKMEKKEAIKLIRSLCKEGIERQKKSPTPGSMIQLLLSARDTEGSGEGMDEEQVMAEAMTMFNAGHDSTAAGLSWTWYELMRNPDSYERLLQETDEQTKQLDAMPQASYALQCAKEALRLYPPAWALPRQSLHDTQLGGYDIPAGGAVNVFTFVMQRDGRFFDEPLLFKPERFAPENEHAHHPFAWIPFGAGPRACIGRDFALMEMQLIITTISRKFRLQLAQGEVELNPITSLEPKNGIRVALAGR